LHEAGGSRSEPVGTDSCSLSRRWLISPRLAHMVIRLEALASDLFSAEGLRWPGLYIISGYRSPEKQAHLNPLAPQSKHTRCPALAVDLRVGDLPASTTPLELWLFVGQLWKTLGGRWGGDFRPEPDNNHFEEITIL